MRRLYRLLRQRARWREAHRLKSTSRELAAFFALHGAENVRVWCR